MSESYALSASYVVLCPWRSQFMWCCSGVGFMRHRIPSYRALEVTWMCISSRAQVMEAEGIFYVTTFTWMILHALAFIYFLTFFKGTSLGRYLQRTRLRKPQRLGPSKNAAPKRQFSRSPVAFDTALRLTMTWMTENLQPYFMVSF